MTTDDAAPTEFLTANGSRDSHAITLATGEPNNSPRAGTPYGTITLSGIRRMMDDPVAVDKADAPFVILSGYHEHDGRTHEVQRQRGVFGALAVDIDKGDPSIEDVVSAVRDIVGDVCILVYSSASATTDNRKWRVIVPLAIALHGCDYPEVQEAFFMLLGKHGLQCDTTLARTGQPIYLPNVPPARRDEDGQPLFYACRPVDGPALELVPTSPIVDTVNAVREQRATLEAARADIAAEAAARRAKFVAVDGGDDFSPIDYFDQAHAIGDLLLRYGFIRNEHATRNHYRHDDLGDSGSYSMEDMGDHWVCMSEWAKAGRLGGTSRSGFQFGDAFDLFAYFEHQNDMKAAVRAYAEEVRGREKSANRKAARAKAAADHKATIKAVTEPDDEPDDELAPAPAGDERSLATFNRPPADAAGVIRPQTMNDIGLGRRLVWAARGRVRYLTDRAVWVRWTGTHWENDRKALEPQRFAKIEALNLWQEMAALGPSAPLPTIRFVQAAGSRKAIDSAVAMARSENEIAAVNSDFDTDPDTLNVANGILNLRTLELRPHDPAAMLTKLAPVNFDPTASAPRWREFIDAVTCGDVELAKFLQRSFGLALSADQSEQRIWMHWGEGSNGKGTCLAVLNSIMGTYSGPAPIEVLLTKRNGDDRELGAAKLCGLRFAFAQEAEDGARLADAAIKALTGSDMITGRNRYENPFSFMPTWHIHMAVNDKPAVRGTDHGIWRRVTLVPWLHTFTGAGQRRRAEVEAELLAEASGILNWLVAGYTAWRATGLQPPEAVTAATAAYRADSDSVRAWLTDACVVEPDAMAGATDLFSDYTHWCQRAGHGKGVSQSKFGKTLDRLGHTKERPSSGDYRFKVVRIGLRLADVHNVHN